MATLLLQILQLLSKKACETFFNQHTSSLQTLKCEKFPILIFKGWLWYLQNVFTELEWFLKKLHALKLRLWNTMINLSILTQFKKKLVICMESHRIIESQNQRITEWLGLEGTLKPIQFQSHCCGLVSHYQLRLLRAPSNPALNTPRNGAATLSGQQYRASPPSEWKISS